MKIPQLATGGENLYEAEITPDGELEIPAITVDSLRLSPSFIKIDVEGHEREVLEGAKETLLRSRPALLVEVIHSEVIPFLSELGYQVRWTLRSNHLFSCNPQ
jgi:FkbM family methyltransferase